MQGIQKQPVQGGRKSIEVVEGGVNKHQGHLTTTKAPAPAPACKEWDWQARYRQAPPPWQEFLQYWRSQPDEDTRNTPYPLPLHIQGLPELNPIILVRKNCQQLFDRAWKLYSRAPHTGIVLTGQPGTGKSTWLWYALTRLLRKKQTVLFSFNNAIQLFHIDTVYIFEENITITYLHHPQLPERTFIWGLIDSDDRSEASPPMGLTTGLIFPVYATSPNEKRYHQFRKRRGALTWGTSLWKSEELKGGLPIQSGYRDLLDAVINALANPSPSPSSDRLVANVMKAFDGDSSRHDGCAKRRAHNLILKALENAITLYGYSARDVYMGIFSPDAIEAPLSEAVKKASWDHLQRAIPSSEEGPGTLSHQLVAVHVKTDGGRSEDKFYLDFKSDHIRDRIRDQLGVVQIRKALSMLRVCLFVPHTASLGGICHRSVDSQSQGTYARLRRHTCYRSLDRVKDAKRSLHVYNGSWQGAIVNHSFL